jgi:hypothetical protein
MSTPACPPAARLHSRGAALLPMATVLERLLPEGNRLVIDMG